MRKNINYYNRIFFDILVLADKNTKTNKYIQYLDDNKNYNDLKDVFDEKYFSDYYDYAINNKLSWALYSFGWMHHAGKGVKQDYEKAVKLYQISITQNNFYAMNNLAFMCENSKGIILNYQLIIDLYELCVKNNVRRANRQLTRLYNSDDILSQDPKQAFRLYNIGAKENNETAINKLAEMYLHGTGTNQDFVKAFELYEINANKNNELAINGLANMHLCGQGTKQNIEKAFELYELNAKQGNFEAKRYLDNIYVGNLAHNDYKLDLELCLFGINKGHKQALTKLAFMYINGQMFEMDYLVGYDILHLAEDNKYMEHMHDKHGATLKQLQNSRKTCIQYALWYNLDKNICDIIATYVNTFQLNNKKKIKIN